MAFYALYTLYCLVCLVALYLAVPKLLFREHLCVRFWHCMGLNPAGDPVFRSGSDPAGVSLFRMRAPQSFADLSWHALARCFYFVSRGFYYVCSYCGHLYFSLEGFKGDLSAPCGRLANGPFLAVLGSDLGGV